MNNKDFSNLGDQIRETVQSAIDSMDFKQLNQTIQQTVSRALDETGRHLFGGSYSSYERRRRNQGPEWKRDMSGYEDAEYRECTVHDAPPEEEARGFRQEFHEAQAKAGAQEGKQTKSGAHARAGAQRSGAGGRRAASSETEPNAQSGERTNAGAGATGANARRNVPKIYINQPSRVAGILYTVFGGIGLGVSGIVLMTVLLVAFVSEPVWEAMLGVLLFLASMFIGFSVMLGKGNSIRGVIKRLKLYLREAEDRPYCMISDLAARAGKNTKYVIKDLDRMIRRGILPKAHLDEKKTYLMLDDETYQQYQLAQESLRRRKEEEQLRSGAAGTSGGAGYGGARGASGPGGAPVSGGSGGSSGASGRAPGGQAAGSAAFAGLDPEQAGAFQRAMEKGQTYLHELREANEAIPGEVISAKLTRLEAVIRKIFESVEKHPDQLEDIERFMEYYLPTTVKLVNAYRDFDSVSIQGDNITMAKGEIEETLDTINQAFERLLDDLYQDAAFDASTDASVLQAMLKKDGWTESDFNGRTGS